MIKPLLIFCFILQIFTGSYAEVDKSWVQNIIKQYDVRHDVKEILSLKSAPAEINVTTLGSEDSRLTLEVLLNDGTKATRSVILKALPSTPALNKQIAESGLFNTEIGAYRDALPKMEQLLLTLYDRSEPLWVRALGFREYDQLLLEDIVEESGYKQANRWEGMNKEQSLLALKGLAKFHALSVMANQHAHNKIKEEFKISLLERNYETLKDFYEVVFNNFAKLIEEKWGPEWSSAAKKIREVAPDVKNRLYQITIKKDSFINALNIGAPNIRNIFFTNHISDLTSSDKPIAVRFAYFQLAFFNSPILDVQYFINTSPNLEVMTKHRNDLLSHYYESLVHYLNKFGSNGKIPTKDEFSNEIKRTNFDGITTAIQILPVRFERSKDNPAETMEHFAEQNKNSNTTTLDPFGMYSKEYTEYMKVLLQNALRDHVL
uniref:Venom protein kinase 1 n=1 Tax=Pristhesancus plagipennis TaxID=1955184 RepID=A0A1Q1NPC9_PRIPG|nr:venom protein kinase 1 [Pristhesancus plagipennis]